ncbi:MAG: aspartate aminotransferase family protein [Bacteroidetes bacterium]|nr:aspartate aminotransferase family protein [Bacteroidota bacterium]
MESYKSLFFKHQAQTSQNPLALEIVFAEGSYIVDKNGKKYLDFVAGVSANTLGHNHPKVNEAVKNQVDKYMHVMVYGEFIQQPQVELASLLAKKLPDTLNCVYLTNSGTEATEGSLKLAKRVTGRGEIIAAKWAYHGNTQGAMSVCGAEKQNSAFRPLIPGVRFIEYNNIDDLSKITNKTAGVILETIQGGAGFIVPKDNYLAKVKARCDEVGALLILDEIQTGVGRTGKLYGFQHYNVVPHIFVTGKGLGGGMPIGAFVSSYNFMNLLKNNPKLGHITTFGGHPVIAAAGVATLKEVCETNLMEQVSYKEQLIRTLLVHPKIIEIRGAGLMLAAMVESAELATKIILKCLENGLILFWLLFDGTAIRITPPLTISEDEIRKGCYILLQALDEV